MPTTLIHAGAGVQYGGLIASLDFRGGSTATDDTTNPITLYSYTVPANTVTLGSFIRFYILGECQLNAHVKTITVKFGSQTLATIADPFNTLTQGVAYTFRGVLGKSDATHIAYFVELWTIAETTIDAVSSLIFQGSAVFDTTVSNNLVLIGTNAAINQSNDIKWHFSSVEYVSAPTDT